MSSEGFTQLFLMPIGKPYNGEQVKVWQSLTSSKALVFKIQRFDGEETTAQWISFTEEEIPWVLANMYPATEVTKTHGDRITTISAHLFEKEDKKTRFLRMRMEIGDKKRFIQFPAWDRPAIIRALNFAKFTTRFVNQDKMALKLHLVKCAITFFAIPRMFCDSLDHGDETHICHDPAVRALVLKNIGSNPTALIEAIEKFWSGFALENENGVELNDMVREHFASIPALENVQLPNPMYDYYKFLNN